MIRVLTASLVLVLIGTAAAMALPAKAPSGAEVPAIATHKPYTEEEFRKAAAAFLRQPITKDGKVVPEAAVVLEFAVNSKEVSVTISSTYASKIGGDKETKYSGVLMGAYMAGNVLAQLDSGVNGNDAYSGEIQVFRVYRYLKTLDPSYKVPEIEEMLAVHAKGGLAAYLAKKEAAGEVKEGPKSGGAGAPKRP
jgi:hypothetical protein